ncbi:MAG: hypothetical protein HRT57_04885, partial [Crocinitomicaceae bacterium]|nr:hypothetical protein [Crocinitomicaceae bacterium]
MSTNKIFRIHPAIGIARVGNSEEFYLGPETMAGMEGETDSDPMGGLPIVPGTENQTITSDHIRDNDGQLKRQAARFKIYDYSDSDISKYPTGAGTEIKVGSVINVDGSPKTVSSIMWQVHLANKKSNSWIEPKQGVSAYDNATQQTPIVRNIDFPSLPKMVEGEDQTCTNSQDVLDSNLRREKLVIDAGPLVVQYGETESVAFTAAQQNQYIASGSVITDVTYPTQFPVYPDGLDKTEKIESLGDMHTDDQGRLIVVGAYGKASGFEDAGVYSDSVDLNNAVNNDGWYDDTADGPVTAIIVLDDGAETLEVQGSAWVITSDPSYAPQVPNVVSLWEDQYNAWVEKFDLEPSMFDPKNTTPITKEDDPFYLGLGYNPDYQPDYNNQIRPILNAAHLQKWATNLVSAGQGAHDTVGQQGVKPEWTQIMSYLRNPNIPNNENEQNGTRMPLSLGDSVLDDPSNPESRVQDFLAFSRTQYFLMYQWLVTQNAKEGTILGAGEKLDRNILANCLGGRFSPGIEMTFIVRNVELYKNWIEDGQHTAAGPFRINMEQMDYSNLESPALGVGFTPDNVTPVEPGDICKFMSIPWHTDYNSCATHTTGNDQSMMTYWSWPAQRPDAVYVAEEVINNVLPKQKWSIRGPGTFAVNPASAATFQDP